MRCPNCKTELKQDDVYCYHCGTRISWLWRFKSHLMAAAIVIVLLIVGTVTGVMLYKNGVFDAKKEVKNDTVAEQPVQTQAPLKEDEKTEEKQDGLIKPTVAPGQTTQENPLSDFLAVDKTKEMKGKLTKLMEQTAPFLSLCARWKELGGGKFTWDDQVATQAVLYDMLYGDPATGVGEMHMRGYDNSYSGIAKRVKEEMKARYGDAYKFDMTYGDTFPYFLFRKQNKKVEYAGEELRSEKCDFKITKVTQVAEDMYEVQIKAGIVKTYNVANGTWKKRKVTIIKDKKSKYGYHITNVQ
ncbi:MAG: zinc ribbon domain-containing protein [Eubacterium sp.]